MRLDALLSDAEARHSFSKLQQIGPYHKFLQVAVPLNVLADRGCQLARELGEPIFSYDFGLRRRKPATLDAFTPTRPSAGLERLDADVRRSSREIHVWLVLHRFSCVVVGYECMNTTVCLAFFQHRFSCATDSRCGARRWTHVLLCSVHHALANGSVAFAVRFFP